MLHRIDTPAVPTVFQNESISRSLSRFCKEGGQARVRWERDQNWLQWTPGFVPAAIAGYRPFMSKPSMYVSWGVDHRIAPINLALAEIADDISLATGRHLASPLRRNSAGSSKQDYTNRGRNCLLLRQQSSDLEWLTSLMMRLAFVGSHSAIKRGQ